MNTTAKMKADLHLLFSGAVAKYASEISQSEILDGSQCMYLFFLAAFHHQFLSQPLLIKMIATVLKYNLDLL